MNRVMKKTTAVLSAAVMTVCGAFGSFTATAAESNEIEVVFDFVLDKSLIEPDYRKDGELTDFNDFASFKTAPGESFFIPNGLFDSETHGFSGWTVDGFYGYTGGETYRIPEDFAEDKIVVKAVWFDYKDERLTEMSYKLEYNGLEVERPEWLKDTRCTPGMIFEPNYTTIKVDNFGPDGYNLTSSGLTDGERVYKFGTRIVVGEEPMTFYPIWLKEIDLTYTAGDVDRINGNSTVTFQRLESGRDELAGNDRFSRSGFNLVGWTSSVDGLVYKPGETVTFPGVDITFTAVWEPKNYNVVFKTGNGGTNIKVPGVTDTTIICPDPEYTVADAIFVGWKDSEGDIYPVGSEYLIKGAIPGSGITLSGVWADPPYNYGDANCDTVVTIADATAIFQAIGNPDKYSLSVQGEINGDCCNPGDGITAADAIAIQKLDAKLIETLPEFIEG
ncbi:MAG: hypothetical protein IKV85_10745 [Ruminococcus sp.]|nr:hypothetical protein [Ruminococcus sp.]